MAGFGGSNLSLNPRTGLPYNQPDPNSSLTNQYGVYNAGVKTNAEDYSGIMEGYRNLLNQSPSAQSLTSNFKQYTPTQIGAPSLYQPKTNTYTPSANTTASLASLKGLADTGGYSEQGIADLRARGISPIRTVYGNAQSNIDRQRALQGGYSPNYNAVTSKMSRELSDQIANATQNVNAGIAQNVASNKLSAAPAYASASGAEDTRRLGVDAANMAAINEANRRNADEIDRINAVNAAATTEANKYNTQGANSLQLEATQMDEARRQNALAGMRSLYGTTPALSQLFGNQALQGAQFQNMINQQNRTPWLNTAVRNG